MKVILDGIVMEKYKGDAEVASCGWLHGDDDDSDATTASNDEATAVTAVTRATPPMPRERSELEVLGDDLQAHAFSASFFQKFEVILAGVSIVKRKPIVLQPLFREPSLCQSRNHVRSWHQQRKQVSRDRPRH